MLGQELRGFVVLPDTGPGATLAEHLYSWGNVVATYPSGRPMIMINCSSLESVVTVASEDDSATIVGQSSITEDGLTRALHTFEHHVEWDKLSERSSGSYHLITFKNGVLRARGTAFGIRRLYYTKCMDSYLLSDRSLLLALIFRAEINHRALAGYLVDTPPFTLAEQPLWVGIEPVAPNMEVILCSGDQVLTLRRWLDLDAAIEHDDLCAVDRVRSNLSAAVAARAATENISCDLSGGYDSSALAFLSADVSSSLACFTIGSLDPTNEDMLYASIAARHLPNAAHHVITPIGLPLHYEQMIQKNCPIDEPSTALTMTARLRHVLGPVKKQGFSIHMTGHGGDQLFAMSPTVIHSGLSSRPLISLSRLIGYRFYYGWSYLATARAVFDRSPYPRWMTRQLGTIRTPRDRRIFNFGWCDDLHVSPWVSDDSVNLLEKSIEEGLTEQQALCSDRGRNARLETIFTGSRLARSASQIAERCGIVLSHPFYDDSVVRASLAIDQLKLSRPGDYKPVMRRAMSGIMPDDLLSRRTKGYASVEVARGLERNASELRELFNTSVLGAWNLIDAQRLANLVSDPASPEMADQSIWATLACELWARAYLSEV